LRFMGEAPRQGHALRSDLHRSLGRLSGRSPPLECWWTRLLPEVLDVPTGRQSLSDTSTGTNVRRRRLNPMDFGIQVAASLALSKVEARL
jgi:hypothetical protein